MDPTPFGRLPIPLAICLVFMGFDLKTRQSKKELITKPLQESMRARLLIGVRFIWLMREGMLGGAVVQPGTTLGSRKYRMLELTLRGMKSFWSGETQISRVRILPAPPLLNSARACSYEIGIKHLFVNPRLFLR